jgi:hypothetical protein
MHYDSVLVLLLFADLAKGLLYSSQPHRLFYFYKKNEKQFISRLVQLSMASKFINVNNCNSKLKLLCCLSFVVLPY